MMSTAAPGAEGSNPGAPSAPGGPAIEPLACVTCRARKLKCDRTKPVCTRCSNQNMECVYPESRRKPAFKRRNVRELEVRLGTVLTCPSVSGAMITNTLTAQVEDLLKDTVNPSARPANRAVVEDFGDFLDASQDEDSVPVFDFANAIPDLDEESTTPFLGNGVSDPPFSCKGMTPPPTRPDDTGTAGALFGLGMFETLPPSEIIEDL